MKEGSPEKQIQLEIQIDREEGTYESWLMWLRKPRKPTVYHLQSREAGELAV